MGALPIMEQSLPEIAQSLEQYGPWGFCALLAIAIVYLFKLYTELEKEVRGIIQKNLQDTLSVVESAKRVMEQTSEAVKEQKATTENLRDIIRIMSGKIQ